jgi:hypothetical protein
MSNPNKNSRFATLLEDTEISSPFKKYNKKSNIDKGKKHTDYNKVNYTNDNNNEKNKSITDDKKIKEEKIIDKKNFPDLSNNIKNKSSIKQTDEIISNSYIGKLKIIKPILLEKESDIKPGWVEIKQDKKFKKIITTYNKIESDSDDDSNSKNIGINIISALADLYYKRTNEYIELWGYDEWEKMFISPSYDYNYFDNLDEQYNIEHNENYDDVNE